MSDNSKIEFLKNKCQRLGKEKALLEERILTHVRENGDYLGDGISRDDQALTAFINHYNPSNWE